MQSQERYMRDELMCHDLAASTERATFPITTNSYQFHVHFERMELLDLNSEFMTQIPRIWELEMTRTHAAHRHIGIRIINGCISIRFGWISRINII